MIRDAARGAGSGPVREVLELGSGGGNNASHMKHAFAMTLVEPADGMHHISWALNPECEHVPGDMRTVRLGRAFDAIFVHEAVMYMTIEDDLRAALTTVAVHLAPVGVALVAPDATTETFREATEHGGDEADGGRVTSSGRCRPISLAGHLLRGALRVLAVRARRDGARRPRRTPRGAIRARDVAGLFGEVGLTASLAPRTIEDVEYDSFVARRAVDDTL